MRNLLFVCLLLGAVCRAQGPQQGQGAKGEPSAVPKTIGMEEVVLTIEGFCPDRKNATEPCRTEITRAQFEVLADAIRPSMSASVRQQFANVYPRLLILSRKAEELGLDKQAPYQQMIDFSRMQILAQAVSRKLQQEASNVSETEMAEYYAKNADSFDQYTLLRMIVPLSEHGAGSAASGKNGTNNQDRGARGSDSEGAASAKQFEDLAESLRARAAAGEDFLKLQKEAFTVAGIKVDSANVSMGTVRVTSLPAAHVAILEHLKDGEVSPVITDSGGHYIYKLESKKRPTLEQAKTEIRHTLATQHETEAVEKVEDSYTIEMNKAYFAVQPSLKPE